MLVLDAPNLYRDIVQELEEGVGCLGQKAYFESDHWGADLSSVQARRRSSEPQVVTAQLVDGPAAHQLHVAFDFGSEIFKRPFNAGLTRGRQSIQVKSPSRARLRAHRKGFQNVGATPGKTLWTVTPGANFEPFFDELGALPPGPPDLAKVAAIFGRYNIDLLPPEAEQR